MAKYGPSSVPWILVDGFDLVGVTTDLEEGTEAILELSHALGDSWEEHLPTGSQRATLVTSGFYDDASDSVNAALSGNQQTSRVVCYAVEGNTIGNKFIGLTGAFGAKYTRVASRGVLHKANAEYTVTGQKDNDGRILHALTAETADGNTDASSVDNTASSAAGGAGYLHVTSITLGTATNLVAKVRHSADDVTYADLITFTASTARTAERKTVTGTVNRHLLASWAWTGAAGGGSTATFMVGFDRG